MSKKIMVIDTETIGLDKKFCYNIGYVIAEIFESGKFSILEKCDFLVKQVWRNTMLFSTAYYAEKKPIYTKMLRNKKDYNISVLRYDEIMGKIQSAIDYHNIEYVYAYNAPFDQSVFEFNCNWFKTENPLAEIHFYDIRAYFMNIAKNDAQYKLFCSKNKYFTEGGNYSSTAENAFRYITNNNDFIEAHTALNDSEIELEILEYCYNKNQDIFTSCKAERFIKRNTLHEYTIKYKDKTYTFKGNSAIWYKNRHSLIIK